MDSSVVRLTEITENREARIMASRDPHDVTDLTQCTTRYYWDCSCNHDAGYIHSNLEERCPHCGAVRDTSPDSLVHEVMMELWSGRLKFYQEQILFRLPTPGPMPPLPKAWKKLLDAAEWALVYVKDGPHRYDDLAEELQKAIRVIEHHCLKCGAGLPEHGQCLWCGFQNDKKEYPHGL